MALEFITLQSQPSFTTNTHFYHKGRLWRQILKYVQYTELPESVRKVQKEDRKDGKRINILTSHVTSFSSPVPYILPALLLKKVRDRNHCTITCSQWGWIKAPASGWEFQTSLCKQNSFSKGMHIFLCRFGEEGRVRKEILIFLHVSEE